MCRIWNFNYDTDAVTILVEKTDTFQVANNSLILEYRRNDDVLFTVNLDNVLDDVYINDIPRDVLQDIFLEERHPELHSFLLQYIDYMKTKRYVNYLWISKLHTIVNCRWLRLDTIRNNIKLFTESINSNRKLKWLLLSLLN